MAGFSAHRMAESFLRGLILDVVAGENPLQTERSITIDVWTDSNPDVVCDVKQGIPLKNNSVDSVLCSHVFEHQKSYDQAFSALKEFKRVLKRRRDCYHWRFHP